MTNCDVSGCGNYAIDKIDIIYENLLFHVNICSYHLMVMEYRER